jgi:hypothetical protein
MLSGYDLATDLRSMTLMTIEWQNSGINMWTIDSGVIACVAGQSDYDLPADTIDLLEHHVRTTVGTTETDTHLARISVSTYASIPNKLLEGKPLQIFLRRLVVNPVAVLWPIPNSADYSLVWWRMRRMEDAGRGVETPDISFRFLPALVAGLAYHIAMKVPDLMPRVQMLKQVYDEQFSMAASEDREKATWRIIPRLGRV